MKDTIALVVPIFCDKYVIRVSLEIIVSLAPKLERYYSTGEGPSVWLERYYY
jgi:hypothetical protein